MTDTNKLEGIIKNSGYKYTFIVATLGISYQALRNKLTNKTEFLPTEIEALCKLLNITDLQEKNIIFLLCLLNVLQHSNESEVK